MSNNVLVVGDVMLDHYIFGQVSRISPEAPVPVVHVKSEKYTLGGCANVAKNLANLQVNTWLCGNIGTDEAGKKIKDDCKKSGIVPALQELEHIPTIQKIRVLGNKQQIVRIDFEEKLNELPTSIPFVNNLLQQTHFKGIIISDYAKGYCQKALCQQLIQFTNQNQIFCIIDPKGNDWERYQGAFLVTPNLSELSAVGRIELNNEHDAAIEQVGKSIREKFELQNLLITRSEKGMTLITAEQVLHIPTQAVEVYDVSGAGDTVVATIMAMLVQGNSLQKSVQIANLAAGYVVSKVGTYAISAQELEQIMNK